MSDSGSSPLPPSSPSRIEEEHCILGFPDAPERIGWLDRTSLASLAIAFVVFSGLVQARSAFFPPRRLGDWNVFARAAWAARTGRDLYSITDDNGFHYLYPPTFAILLAPLADAPPTEARDGLLPYPVTVLYWYYFNLACLGLAAHWLAGALEESSPSSRRFQPTPSHRRWWGLRLWPMLACLPPIGHTLMRGQVGVLLLLFLSGMIVSVVRGRSLRAGGWLACAICLKVIPALLLIYPLLRRDFKCLGGCLAGILVGLVAIPVAARGLGQTCEDYRRWNQVMLAPAIANGSDTSRAREVLNVTATDSQSFLAMFHNTLFLNRETRPAQATPLTRRASLLASAALLVGWLAMMRRCRGDDPISTMLVLGALVEVMLLVSPVCHLHYFCLSLPLIAGLFAAAWENVTAPRLGIGLGALVAVNLGANIVPHFPGMEVWRDIGIAGHAAIVLVAAAAVVVWRRAAPRDAYEAPSAIPARAAA